MANAAVDNNEYVYRRVPNNECYFNPALNLPVSPQAFRPRSKSRKNPSDKGDHNGISVYREVKVSPRRVAEEGKSQKGYYVVKIRVREFSSLGLEIVPDEDNDALPGHCVVPKINCCYDQLNADQTKEIQLELAKAASANVVFEPEVDKQAKRRNMRRELCRLIRNNYRGLRKYFVLLA